MKSSLKSTHVLSEGDQAISFLISVCYALKDDSKHAASSVEIQLSSV